MEYLPLTPEQFTKPTDDYLRVMTATNPIAIADVPANVASILDCYQTAKDEQAELLTLPELCVTGYSTADLFLNQHVREQAVKGLSELAAATKDGPAMAVGVPLVHNDCLYNCAAMLADGQIQGIVPKSYLPNYNEFYEKRWFSSGRKIRDTSIKIGDVEVPFGVDLHFDINGTRVGMEICEDGWATISPSTIGALNGAKIYVNLSASNEIIGKADYRRQIFSAMGGKAIQGYAYSSAGVGESIADVVYGGAQLITENGHLVAELKAFDNSKTHLVHDFDVTYLEHDRLQNKTFGDQADEDEYTRSYRVIPVHVPQPADDILLRKVEPYPYVPSNPETLDERCEDLFTQASQALVERILDSKSQHVMVGLSGGLDSLLTLFSLLEAAKRLGRPASMIHTITMPGPASSDRTQNNAMQIAEALSTTGKVMPISELSSLLLQVIGHDGKTEDVTYENTQARMRTNILMDYGNFATGFVVGTGDMSEITQGWCTYNGDQMSMYNPNAGIPKTLVRHLAQWYVANRLTGAAQHFGQAIIDTPVSPELTGNGDLSQLTEDSIGPYALHDFFDYHKERYGERPTKIGYLATIAFKDIFDAPTITKWLSSFLYRDVKNQWKIEASPNGPKYGSVAKSPRGDRRMAPNVSSSWMR